MNNIKHTPHYFNGALPSVEQAGIAAVKISETISPELNAKEQAFFIAGFSECIKWLASGECNVQITESEK